MSTQSSSRINRLSVLVTVISLVFAASAGPAVGAHSPVTGWGFGGEGWELGPDVDDFCTDNNGAVVATQFETTYYDITHSSATYEVYDHNNALVAKYSGPIAMRIDHGDMVSYPTHAEPGECVDATGSSTPIPLTDGSVSGSSGTGSVLCNMASTNGTYKRWGDDDIEMVFELNCSVTGNQSGATGTVNNVPIEHVVTGTQVPCYQVSGGCSNPDAGSKLDTDFTASDP